jgi:hypothetical protein
LTNDDYFFDNQIGLFNFESAVLDTADIISADPKHQLIEIMQLPKELIS